MKKILFIFLLIFFVLGLGKITQSNKTTFPTPLKQQQVAIPKSLNISSINVKAEFESVGMDSKGRMDVPKNPANVAWYNLGPKPGDLGSAVVAGHLDDVTGAPAVFWNLNKLKIGDLVNVVDKNNREYVFKVYKIASYPYQNFPLQKVFADTTGKYLNLITCSGTWDKNKRSYTTRTVIFTKEI